MSHGRPHERWLVALALSFMFVLVLASCARTPQPSTNQSDTVSVVDVHATSQTSIFVRFNTAVSDSAEDPANYHVRSSATGEPLEVISARRNSGNATVLLATDRQETLEYTVTIEDIEPLDEGAALRSSSSAFSGSSERAPFVAYAIALSTTEVLVTFANPPPGSGAQVSESALNPAYYDIIEPDPKYAVTPDLEIIGIRWADERTGGNADRSMVIIETSPQNHTLYEIKVTNVVTRAGDKLIDPLLNRATFNGIPAEDVTPPRLVSATATSNTSVLVRFSEPVTRAGG